MNDGDLYAVDIDELLPLPTDKIAVKVLELSTGRSPFADWFKTI